MKKHIRIFAMTVVAACATTIHAAIITVNTTNNVSPGVGETNLVQAIDLLQDGDTIRFNIPGTGPHYLATPEGILAPGGGGGYPEITNNNVTIDGFSQPASSPNSNTILASNNAVYRIVLDSRAGGRHVWDIDGYGTSESGILVVSGNNFHLQGVCLIGVYGIEEDDTNPKIYGVAFGRGAKDGHVSGCWFGVDPNGTNVYGINDAVTGFGTVPNGRTERITIGVKAGASDPKAQHNVIVGEQIPIIVEAKNTRVSGNFFGILPDGVTDKGPVEFFEGFVEIGRDAANTLIGTDGDGINDAEERNVFGGVTTDVYDDILEFYGDSTTRTNVVIAGNYFGVGIDGKTLFTNSTILLDGINNAGNARIGSDFDGVSDDIEGNVIFMNNPFAGLFPDPTSASVPRFLALGAGARVSVRGNTMVNNNLAPFSYADGSGGRLDSFTNYSAPYMDTNSDIIPILSTNSIFPRLTGTCAVPVAPYTNLIIDVYQLDPEGWANGKLFGLLELISPDGSITNGFPQGHKYLGSFVDNGPKDNNPAVGQFSLDLSGLDLGNGPVTVTANYSADPPGTHNGRTHTSNFSNPIGFIPVSPPGDQLYDDPSGGWTYALNGSSATAGPGGTNFTSLDGTWSHDNGSDTWDGSAIGGNFVAGSNAPGGVSSIDGYLRIQDSGDPRNAGFADPGNRKIYFGHNITAEGASATVLNDGVTLHFRARISTAGLLDDRFITAQTNYPASGDGYTIHDNGKGNFGIKQANGGIISFSLATSVDTPLGPALVMNNRNGTANSADVDTGEAGTANVVTLDPTTWHEFWITIRADTTGLGTHRVDIYLDGSLLPRTFYVTAGTGDDFAGISYVATGCGSTGQSGAFDVDYYTYKLGAVAPSGSAVPVIASASLAGSNFAGTWAGGRPPYTVQAKAALTDAEWVDLVTFTNTSAVVPISGSSAFFRVANRVVFNVSLTGANERPNPVTTSASAGGTLTLDGNKLTVDVSYANLSTNLSGVHFHGPATAEETAGVIINLQSLNTGTTSGSVKGSVTMTAQQVKWLLNGLLYMNIHTDNNPGGEIRGQIPAVQKLQFVARLNGANERPTPITTSGQGAATLVLDNNQLKLDLNYYGLSGAPSAAHIHGPATTEQFAGVLVGIDSLAVNPPLAAAGKYSGTLTLTSAQVLDLLDGLTYLNIHTGINGGGEIRGQITP